MIDAHLDAAPAVPVRAAVPADAGELIRLRAIMLAGLTGAEPADGPWQQTGATLLRERLDAGFTAFVVDDPGVPGRLAACVVGIVEQRLPSPGNPTGRAGYVFSVATDPRHRRRGYSRACMRALLRWYADHDVTAVELHTSAAAEPLYASLGFTRSENPPMRLAG